MGPATNDTEGMRVGASVVARWLDIAARIDNRDTALLHPLRAFNLQGRRHMLRDALSAAERSATLAHGRLEQQMALVLAAELRAALTYRPTPREGP